MTDCFEMNDEMVQSNSLVLSRHIINSKAAWAGVDMALFDWRGLMALKNQ